MCLRSATDHAAPADLIDKNTYEIRQDDDKTVYKSLEEIADDLPDHSPRFVLLSYPLTLVRILTTTGGPSVPPPVAPCFDSENENKARNLC